MRRALLLMGFIAGCGTSTRSAPRSATQVPEPATPKGVTCNYDSDCFGGQGSCVNGECSLRPGLEGARRSFDKPSPPRN